MKKRIISLLIAGILCVSSSLNVLADTGSISDIDLVNQEHVSTVDKDFVGDAKFIYVPENLDVHIEFTGTSAGTMSYTIEEYNEGVPVGRANYYDIPLNSGSIYSQIITSEIDIEQYDQLYLYEESGDVISANEYLNALTSDATVEIDGNTPEGGLIFGAGTYAKGDEVFLYAVPDDGLITANKEGTMVLYVVASETDNYLQEVKEIHLNIVKNCSENPDISDGKVYEISDV